MNKALLIPFLKWALAALVALVLYGRLSADKLLILIGIFIAMRLIAIATALFRIRGGPANSAQSSRTKLEIFGELGGLIAFMILIPLDAALATFGFFSFRLSHGWSAALFVAACALLYLAPRFWRAFPGGPHGRALYWFGPFFPALFVAITLLATKHPYLNPLDPEHNRLAAEKVLSLLDLHAEDYIDWILRYAVQLDDEGNTEAAADYYRAALRLDSRLDGVRLRLAALEPAATETAASYEPYWSSANPIAEAARFDLNYIEPAEQCSVILVGVGEVPDRMFDAAAHTIRQELGLETIVADVNIPLPPPTKRGLVSRPEWDDGVIYKAFYAGIGRKLDPLVRYIVLTPANLREDEAHGASALYYDFGAIVSFDRYISRGAKPLHPKVLHRIAKVSLSVLIGSFGVPSSIEPACVTSNGPSERKGNRPTAATMALFKAKVAALNARAQLRKATAPAVKPESP